MLLILVSNSSGAIECTHIFRQRCHGASGSTLWFLAPSTQQGLHDCTALPHMHVYILSLHRFVEMSSNVCLAGASAPPCRPKNMAAALALRHLCRPLLAGLPAHAAPLTTFARLYRPTCHAASREFSTSGGDDFLAASGATFASLGLHPRVCESLASAGFDKPAQVQVRSCLVGSAAPQAARRLRRPPRSPADRRPARAAAGARGAGHPAGARRSSGGGDRQRQDPLLPGAPRQLRPGPAHQRRGRARGRRSRGRCRGRGGRRRRRRGRGGGGPPQGAHRRSGPLPQRRPVRAGGGGGARRAARPRHRRAAGRRRARLLAVPAPAGAARRGGHHPRRPARPARHPGLRVRLAVDARRAGGVGAPRGAGRGGPAARGRLRQAGGRRAGRPARRRPRARRAPRLRRAGRPAGRLLGDAAPAAQGGAAGRRQGSAGRGLPPAAAAGGGGRRRRRRRVGRRRWRGRGRLGGFDGQPQRARGAARGRALAAAVRLRGGHNAGRGRAHGGRRAGGGLPRGGVAGGAVAAPGGAQRDARLAPRRGARAPRAGPPGALPSLQPAPPRSSPHHPASTHAVPFSPGGLTLHAE
jgi:hypothetical protein